MTRLRVLHCPTTVGGNPQGLAKAEREIGLESFSLTLRQNYFNYQADEVLFEDQQSLVYREFRRWLAIYRSLAHYDVIHYNFGSSLTPDKSSISQGKYPIWAKNIYNLLYAGWADCLDVKLAKRLGKIIAVTYQGDDARQGDYCRTHYPVHFIHEIEENYYTDESDKQRRLRIKIFDKYADLIYALNPDLLNVLPERTKFMPYASVDPRAWRPIYVSDVPSIPHVVHAPSHRLIKGTRFVLDAFQRLQSEGVQFRYSLVEGVSNREAKRIYETADLLIDQLLAGFYGGLAVELMALGKPVICYLRNEDLYHLPERMWSEMPIINATPNSIYDVLKEWLTTRKHELRSRGIAARAYVEKWHDPLKISASLKEDYELALKKRLRKN